MDYEQVKKLMAVQERAKLVQTELADLYMDVCLGDIVVTVSGQLKIISIRSDGHADVSNAEFLQTVATACNLAIERAQIVSAEKMKSVIGEFKLQL